MTEAFVLRETDAHHLEQIPEQFAHALRAAHAGHGSYKVAAEDLGIKLNTLKTRVHRGRQMVQKLRDKSVENQEAAE